MNLRITLAVAVAIVASQVATSFKFSPASKWLLPSSLSDIYKTGAGSRLSLVEKNMVPHMLLSDNKDMSIQCHFNLQMYIDRKSTHRRVVISETSLRMSANDEDEDEDGDYDDDEEISIEEAFDDLSNGKKLAPYEAILEWDVVSELIQEKIITTKEFQKMFIEAGTEAIEYSLYTHIMQFTISNIFQAAMRQKESLPSISPVLRTSLIFWSPTLTTSVTTTMMMMMMKNQLSIRRMETMTMIVVWLAYTYIIISA